MPSAVLSNLAEAGSLWLMMLRGLEGNESHVMPYLVHRLIHLIGGLDAASDCITWPFFLHVGEK